LAVKIRNLNSKLANNHLATNSVTMTNRLALHHILTTQLRRDWEQEESAKTRLSQLSRRDRIKASLRSSQLPGRYLLPDTRKTYDNMVANIHSTMKCKLLC